MLLEQLDLKRQIAEAQAAKTQKKVYQNEAHHWQKTAEETRQNIAYAQAQTTPTLDKDTQANLTKMFRETLLKIHPDRYDNDPEKRSIVTKLTQELVAAYKKSDFEAVKATFGVIENRHYLSTVQNQLTMDVLFEKM